tara:strand:- start:408 stop:1046 length:639 start_codon:yes stop_codon:yes gene_type:complete
MKTLDKQLEGELIKHLITQKVQELSQGKWFYSVIHYGDWDNDGNRREWDEMKGLYHSHYMRGVHKRHRNILREHFSRNICLVFTLERHKSKKERIEVGKYLQYGDERNGKYHTNLLIGPITDQVIEEPKSKLKRVLNTLSHHPYNDLTDLKIDLINTCIRLHPDVNKYGHSVKTQVLLRPQDLLNTGHYSLKDITKKGLDFMEVLDTENSDI